MARGQREAKLQKSRKKLEKYFQCILRSIQLQCVSNTKGEKDMITRREFVAGAGCCAAFAGKLMAQGGDAFRNEKLVAPCGLFCGACPAYIATHVNNAQAAASKPEPGSKPSLRDMQCDGCLGGGRLPAHAPKCAIRICAVEKTKTGRCSECQEFPCSLITDFNNDGILHHAEVLENLRQLRKMGIDDWTKREDAHWQCPKCQARLGWYDAECPKCKAPRPDRLFPLKKA
jgi:hypothetical protein